MDKNYQKHIKIEKFIEDFREFADRSIWRNEQDETIAYFGLGNVEDFLRKKLNKLLD